MTDHRAQEAIARAHREEWARVVATLARRFGDLDLVEDAAAEAFAAAVERWPGDGIPPNPGGWLTTTATRRAIDRIRRESQRDAKHQAAQMLYDDTPPEPTGPVEDDRLRLVFTCCHPALSTEARVALTLRLVGGLTVAEIARAFLVQETAMARRITRAKAKIKAAHIPYRVPSEADLVERLQGVLAVIFLVFNEGYLASEGEDPLRVDLSDEAIRLGRLLHELLPDDGEVTGLLALMLLTDARRHARISRTGELVTLEDQDRGAWDRDLIGEGHALVRERMRVVAAGGPPPGRYQLLAAVNAVHTAAPSARDTDWSQVLALYDRLAATDPSPIVRLNRAVAVAEVDGPAVGLAEVDRLADVLEGYHPLHAEDPLRVDLSDEAIRLGRLLHELLPDEGEVTGLLALMLLTDARRHARISRTGELVTLEEQDRAAWDRDLIAEGHALVRERMGVVAAGGPPPGRYQLLAAVNAVHTAAPSARDTDWSQVLALYDRLAATDPSPIVRLNRAVAVAEVDGPAVGLAEVDRLADALEGYHPLHVARAELLRRLGRSGDARTAYEQAIALAGNPAERTYLTRRRDQLGSDR